MIWGLFGQVWFISSRFSFGLIPDWSGLDRTDPINTLFIFTFNPFASCVSFSLSPILCFHLHIQSHTAIDWFLSDFYTFFLSPLSFNKKTLTAVIVPYLMANALFCNNPFSVSLENNRNLHKYNPQTHLFRNSLITATPLAYLFKSIQRITDSKHIREKETQNQDGHWFWVSASPFHLILCFSGKHRCNRWLQLVYWKLGNWSIIPTLRIK